MIERSNIPAFELPSGLNILAVEEFNLSNGIPVHVIKGGTQDVVKIDFIFPAGSVQASKPLIASFANNLMQEGTALMSAYEVAEKIDYYGAFLGQSTNYHHAQLSLYALTKHLSNVLPVLEEVIKKPSFSEHEFEVYKAKRKQDFLVDSEKVKTIAHRKAQQVLYGKNHPYGRIAELNHFDEINLEDIVAFHKSQYASNLCSIVVSGQPGENIIEVLNSFLGGNDWSNDTVINDVIPVPDSEKEHQFVERKEQAMQSAIRIGIWHLLLRLECWELLPKLWLKKGSWLFRKSLKKWISCVPKRLEKKN
jgi:predicted Zn-dependent peptidase